MRIVYDYDKRLNFVPMFNVWQHDFTASPYKEMVEKNIRISKDAVAAFEAPEGVTLSKYSFESDDASVYYYVISPSGNADLKRPTIFYFHGGGFICPLDVMMLNNGCFYAKHLSCNVILPEYRLVPKHPADVMLMDCINMYKYALENADTLHIDPARIIVFGDSAGGCLAFDTVHYIKEKGLTMPKGMMLIYPVTDDDLSPYDSMNLEHAEWNKEASMHMWELFYKTPLSSDDLRRFLIPMKAEDFSCFPKTYIEVAEFDSLKDQGKALASKLVSAGTDVSLSVIPGTYHGFDNQKDNPFVVETLDHRCKVMKDMI